MLESLFILVVVFIYQSRPPGASGFSVRKWAITQVTRLFISPFNVMGGGGNDGYWISHKTRRSTLELSYFHSLLVKTGQERIVLNKKNSILAARIAFPKLASLMLSPPRKLMLGIPMKIAIIEK